MCSSPRELRRGLSRHTNAVVEAQREAVTEGYHLHCFCCPSLLLIRGWETTFKIWLDCIRTWWNIMVHIKKYFILLCMYKYGFVWNYLCNVHYHVHHFFVTFHRRRPPWSRLDEDTNLRASSGSLEGSSEMLVFAFNLANLRETSRNKVNKIYNDDCNQS